MGNLLLELTRSTCFKAWRACCRNSLASFGMLVAITASGHPETSARIEAITAQIEHEPANAQLYLQRADLRRQEKQFGPGLADVATAARLKRDWPRVSLVRGQIQFDQGQPEEALRSVEQFLRSETNHAPALLLRAHCHRQLGQADLAVKDYDAALKVFAQPNPDLFVERARLESALGRFERAIAGLDEGMRRLGKVPGLEIMAIELERRSGQFDAALQRIDGMAKNGSNGLSELLLKAEVMEQAGRLELARDVFNQVVLEDAHLPRRTEASAALRQEAKRGLQRIDRKLSLQ